MKIVRIVILSIVEIIIVSSLIKEVVETLGNNDYDAAIFFIITIFLGTLFVAMFYPWRKRFGWKGALKRMFLVLVLNVFVVFVGCVLSWETSMHLSQAIELGRCQKVKRIIARDKKNSDKYNSDNYRYCLEHGLNQAVVNQDWKMVETLLEYNINLDSFKFGRQCPLSTAIMINSSDAYNKLIEYGANPMVNGGEQIGFALFSDAGIKLEMLKMILNAGVDPGVRVIAPDLQNRRIDSPALHRLVLAMKDTSSYKAKWQAVKIILDSGGDINQIDQRGKTPMLYADNEEIKERLRQIGAVDIQIIRDGTELYWAVEKDDIETVKKLIAEKPFLIEIGDQEGGRPLYRACRNYTQGDKDCLEIINALLNAGANPNVYSDYNSTPVLALLYEKGTIPVIELLLKHGAILEERDLAKASDYNNIEVVKFLLNRGVSVSEEVAYKASSGDYSEEISKNILNSYNAKKKRSS